MRKLAFLLSLAALGAVSAHAADGDAVKGKTVYARCIGCHTLSGPSPAGPSLVGVIGRKAGTAPGANYSAAMKNSGIVWDAAKLDAYLANPGKMVPGGTMFIMVPAAQDRADVIAYLATLKPAP